MQGVLEDVLGRLYRRPVDLTCAGRTDAGVHARGQVAHLDAPESSVDRARINRALPSDIRVLALSPAPDGFDARFSAIWRRYTYRIDDRDSGPAPLARHTTLPWARPLDLGRMNEAARGLLGEHDFAAFCKQREYASTVRELMELSWTRDDGVAVMAVQADAFCHSMVRSLVGALLPVGDGRQSTTWPAEVLAGRRRSSGVTVMPPYPLVLEGVGYPPDGELLDRQARTRTRRNRAGA